MPKIHSITLLLILYKLVFDNLQTQPVHHRTIFQVLGQTKVKIPLAHIMYQLRLWTMELAMVKKFKLGKRRLVEPNGPQKSK